MISVVTPTYNTPPETLARLWASLKAQTHQDFEVVIYDDSTTDEVYRQIYGYCADERYRIRYIRPMVPSGGNIGYVKRAAFGAAFGDILVEADHDDFLEPDCLASIQEYADKIPYSGFFYSDWCEITPSGFSAKYPDGWAFGYGDHYWSEEHQVWAMKAPEINRTTLSHIVSVPNHVRAWRRETYWKAGGHDPALPVADDYDLLVRTALVTRMTHIPRMLYRQYISPTTAQRTKNDLIQQLVPEIHAKYSAELDVKYTD